MFLNTHVKTGIVVALQDAFSIFTTVACQMQEPSPIFDLTEVKLPYKAQVID